MPWSAPANLSVGWKELPFWREVKIYVAKRLKYANSFSKTLRGRRLDWGKQRPLLSRAAQTTAHGGLEEADNDPCP
jgi:hypothetical protein